MSLTQSLSHWSETNFTHEKQKPPEGGAYLVQASLTDTWSVVHRYSNKEKAITASIAFILFALDTQKGVSCWVTEVGPPAFEDPKLSHTSEDNVNYFYCDDLDAFEELYGDRNHYDASHEWSVFHTRIGNWQNNKETTQNLEGFTALLEKWFGEDWDKSSDCLAYLQRQISWENHGPIAKVDLFPESEPLWAVAADLGVDGFIDEIQSSFNSHCQNVEAGRSAWEFNN